MGSRYNNDIFKQLQEVLECCDKLDNTIKSMKAQHKAEVNRLNDKIDSLQKENDALKIENKRLLDNDERMRRRINNDTPPFSLLHPQIRRRNNPILITTEKRAKRNVVDRKGISGKYDDPENSKWINAPNVKTRNGVIDFSGTAYGKM